MFRCAKTKSVVALLVVLLAVGSVAIAKTVYPRHYVGSNSQGYAVDIKVSKSGKLMTMKSSYDVFCPTAGGAFSVKNIRDQAKLSKSRKFKTTWSFSTDLADDPSIGTGNLTGDVTGGTSGTLGKKKATGRYNEHLKIKDGAGQIVADCDTGAIKFTAKASK